MFLGYVLDIYDLLFRHDCFTMFQTYYHIVILKRSHYLIHTHPNLYPYFIMSLNTGTDVLFLK